MTYEQPRKGDVMTMRETAWTYGPINDGGPVTCVHSSGCDSPATHLVVSTDEGTSWAATTRVSRLGRWETLDDEGHSRPRFQRLEFCKAHASAVATNRNGRARPGAA